MNSEFLKAGTIVSSGSGRVLIGWGKRSWSKRPSLKETSFYFPDFFLSREDPWFQHEHVEEFSLHDLIDELSTDASISPLNWQEPDLDIFSSEFVNLQSLFREQTLQKAVPYVFYRTKDSFNLRTSLTNLLSHALKFRTFVYGFWSETEGMLGGTPERLFELDADGKLITDALAGTCSLEQAKDLAVDSKICSEHQLVIDGISSSLSKYGKVSIGKTQPLPLAHLCHLSTPISLNLTKEHSLNELIQALHPTPALGGYPKNESQKWLSSYAALIPRGRYGAPAGVFNKGMFVSYVAIRNIQWDQQGLSLGVGCGVVEASDLVKEIEEIRLKFKATRSMLCL
jgi:menaquinone-specific isochorismate synthase